MPQKYHLAITKENKKVLETAVKDSKILTALILVRLQEYLFIYNSLKKRNLQAGHIAPIKDPLDPCPATGLRIAAKTFGTVHQSLILGTGS